MKVFCYGTLMRGFSNNRLLLSTSKFVSTATTCDEFAMMLVGFPVLLRDRGEVGRVVGEVYCVDAETLEDLDGLEGEGQMYLRESIDVVLEDGETIQAMVYIGAPAFWGKYDDETFCKAEGGLLDFRRERKRGVTGG